MFFSPAAICFQIEKIESSDTTYSFSATITELHPAK
jgi:hypothetical protein